MRAASLSFASFAVVLTSSLFVLHCGGETESLGRQGSEQGAGGSGGGSAGGRNAGGSNPGGSGNNGGAGGPAQGCPALFPVCKDGEYAAFGPPPKCSSCETCPAVPEFLGDCPNGSRAVRDPQSKCVTSFTCNDDCPVFSPPSPDFCKGGTLVAQKGEDGCSLPPTCKCDPQPECPPNTKTIKDPAGGCTITCESPSCIEIVEPSADQCPSGGFTPKYGADGCITGYSCVTCPVAGDPSFCANGTVVVPLKKDGTCDYAKLACVPCAPAEPPFPGFCNDGAKVVKKDGKCLGATECSCLDQSACPPDRKTLPIPGSACQLFTCNKVDCPTPSQPSGSCDGNYVWQRDANDCATTALCTPPGN